jgi:hypothetical protein
MLCLVSRHMKECSLYMFIPRFLETVWIWYDLIVWYRVWSVEWLVTKCAPWHEYNCVYVTSWSVEVLWPKNPTYPKCQKRRVRLSKAATTFNGDHLRRLHKEGQATCGWRCWRCCSCTMLHISSHHLTISPSQTNLGLSLPEPLGTCHFPALLSAVSPPHQELMQWPRVTATA